MPRPGPREGLFPCTAVGRGDRSAQVYTKQDFKAKARKSAVCFVLSMVLYQPTNSQGDH